MDGESSERLEDPEKGRGPKGVSGETEEKVSEEETGGGGRRIVQRKDSVSFWEDGVMSDQDPRPGPSGPLES